MPQALAIHDTLSHRRSHPELRKWLIVLGVALAVFALGLAIIADYIEHNASPILRASVINTLSERFHSPVQLDSLDISLINGIQVHGRGLRILYLAGPSHPDIAQTGHQPVPPMLSVDSFNFRTDIFDLLNLHLNIDLDRVDVDGMELRIPPHGGGQILASNGSVSHGLASRFNITVEKIFCNNVKLLIETADPSKEPLQFDIQNLELTDVGTGHPLTYVASVVNPKPIGDVHATGHFGPWQGAEPSSTPIDGTYSFPHADLSTISGLRGTLSSTGKFQGHLNHLAIDGTTSTPNFSLDVSDHPLPLSTTFHAHVDGTTGDTLLDAVSARLGHSVFTCTGTVQHIPSQGHDIALTIHMPRGRMEDVLNLGMKTSPPVLRGAIALQANLHIPPGPVRVDQKLQIDGNILIQDASFSNPKLQSSIDTLSLRAQGKPAKPTNSINPGNPTQPTPKTIPPAAAAPVTPSRMAVAFALANATLSVRALHYQIPGADIHLLGVYAMSGNLFEFKGHLRTTATASQMVTGWKSFLLKPFDGLLKKDGAGLEVPIELSGTNGDVRYGLAMHGTDETLPEMRADLKARRQETSAQTPTHASPPSNLRH